ncbi:MAG TPA: cytochrome d ubiquinol oxidase subunit II [Candidatus Cybelea sp.]|jgi:cytochrome d ubiquinol oxidase subunit II
MSTVAFNLLAFMLTVYVILDGYDLGVATIAPLVARTSNERAAAMHAIGPYWNGNEVWLIVAGGALFALFPKAYASVFSGFYLPFIVVLWLLMFRGMAMELRDHFTSAIWHDFWDFCFSASSALLILLFGVTLGNLVRGVPLDQSGYFIGTFSLLLNPFAVLVGFLAIVVLSMHGASFIMLRVAGPPVARARMIVALGVPVAFVLYAAATAEVFSIIGWHIVASPWVVLPVIAIACLAGETIAALRGDARTAFGLSCAFLISLLIGAAAAMYPYVLPGYPHRATGLSIATSSPSSVALFSALAVSIVGLCIVVAYAAYVFWSMRKQPVL